MIKAFKHKGLKTLFETGTSRAIATNLHARLIRQLDLLNRARLPLDMNLPGYRLHELKGNRKETYAVTISGNWRLTFTFIDADASDVDLEDYH